MLLWDLCWSCSRVLRLPLPSLTQLLLPLSLLLLLLLLLIPVPLPAPAPSGGVCLGFWLRVVTPPPPPLCESAMVLSNNGDASRLTGQPDPGQTGRCSSKIGPEVAPQQASLAARVRDCPGHAQIGESRRFGWRNEFGERRTPIGISQ